MSTIEIRRIADAGEQCWGIRLLSDGEVAFESIEAVSKGAAHSMAKALKHGQAGVPSVHDKMASKGSTGAIAHTTSAGPVVKFALFEDVMFRVLQRPSSDVPSIGEVEAWLVDVDILWSPPEEDPARKAKDADHTETKGIPGS